MDSKIEKKETKVEEPKKTKIYHKIPTEVFNTVIQQLLTTTCKLSDGINLLNALKRAEIVGEDGKKLEQEKE